MARDLYWHGAVGYYLSPMERESWDTWYAAFADCLHEKRAVYILMDSLQADVIRHLPLAAGRPKGLVKADAQEP